jgi:zinc D-Ala-D-Ala carboxypeptidase
MSALQMDCPKCWGKNKACPKCHGTGKCEDKQLSPHFRLSELLASNTAKSKGLDNDPSPEIEANLKALCEHVLEPIRAAVGPLKINSGYRSDAVNKAVGGSTTSAHSYGLAADLHPPAGCKKLMNDIIACGVKLDQIIFERTWVHVGYLNPKTKAQRGDKLSMFVVNGKTTYEAYDSNDKRITA